MTTLEELYNISELTREGSDLHFKINACGHYKKCKEATLRQRGLTCRSCNMRKKYLLKCLDIDYNECKITCTKCSRVYHRSSCKLTKDLNKFTCFCKLQRGAEREFYDCWYRNSSLKLYKNYNFYGTGLNHSSDFYCKIGDKIVIIHLDDSSHRGKLNQSNDIKKLLMTVDNDNIYNFYVLQDAFLDDMDIIMNQIIDRILDLDDSKVIYFGDDGKFYNYIDKALEEHWGVLFEC